MQSSSARLLCLALVTGTIACDGKPSTLTARGSVVGKFPRVVIDEIMANPRVVADEHGEWFELRNLESTAVSLRGWTLTSQNDRGLTIDRSVSIPPAGFVVLARN